MKKGKVSIDRPALKTVIKDTAVEIATSERDDLDQDKILQKVAGLDDRANPMLRLEVIDATLGCLQRSMQTAPGYQRQALVSAIRQLEGILREGDSAFTVSQDYGGLERRIDETLHAS